MKIMSSTIHKGGRHMNRSGWRSYLTALLTAIIAGVSLLSLSSLPAWAAKAGTIKEFPIPTKSAPIAITAGPDGNLWFTEIVFGVGEIGRITPNGRFTVFPIPTASSMPEGITAGPDGNLWFTEEAGNQIGRITPAGSITEFPLPTNCGLSGGCEPWSITSGPDGNLWFTELDGNRVGRITTTGSITEFRLVGTCGYPTGCVPIGITSGPDGNLWFTLFIGNSIVRLTPSGSFTGAFHTPTKTSRPYGI